MCVLVFVISLKGCKFGDFKRNSRDSCLADRVFATLMFKFTQTDSADENKAIRNLETVSFRFEDKSTSLGVTYSVVCNSTMNTQSVVGTFQDSA